MKHTRRSAWLPVGLVVSLALVLTGVGAASAVAPVDVWWLSNTPGFGNPNTQNITALGAFEGQLYAGTASKKGLGTTQLWRRNGRFGAWSLASTGLGNPNNLGIDDLVVFGDRFYAGIWNQNDGGEIRRTSDGSTWGAVVTGGKGNTHNAEVTSLAVFGGKLYAGTYNDQEGAEIWCSATGADGSWSTVVAGGKGNAANFLITSFEVFNGNLYAAVLNDSGGRIWRSDTGNLNDWEDVTASGGFGTNHGIYALGVLGGQLYASTIGDYISGSYSATVWRCATCEGSDWEKVLGEPVLSSHASTRSGLISLPSVFCPVAAAAPRSAARPDPATTVLYFIVGNSATGMEVWATPTGDAGTWAQVGFEGFGDPNNQLPYSDRASAVYGDHLFVGTYNNGVGAEIWQLLPCVYQNYLPMVLKR
jgi:hypothetical protein